MVGFCKPYFYVYWYNEVTDRNVPIEGAKINIVGRTFGDSPPFYTDANGYARPNDFSVIGGDPYDITISKEGFETLELKGYNQLCTGTTEPISFELTNLNPPTEPSHSYICAYSNIYNGRVSIYNSKNEKEFDVIGNVKECKEKNPDTYTAKWGQVTGYATPKDQTKTLGESETIEFYGEYIKTPSNKPSETEFFSWWLILLILFALILIR